jgi:uncharacterized protein (TIGR03086 family)
VGDRLEDVLGDADPAAALARVGRANVDSWGRDDALSGECVLPFGTFPAVATYLINLGEIVVHGWDVAVASGQQASFDDDLATMVLGFYAHAPMDVLRARGAFGPAVDVAPDELALVLVLERRAEGAGDVAAEISAHHARTPAPTHPTGEES